MLGTDPAALVAERLGLRLEGAMRGRVERAVRERARARGEPPEAYVRSGLRDPAERDALVDAVTVQETGFFRDRAHFELLVRRALPSLRGPGVVWSAGCANGQEAWSLAMALEEVGATDWTVLATDVSRAALARAAAGRYAERELRGLSEARRARFLRRRDGEWEIGARLRRRVVVRPHDLAEQPPPPEAGDCRIVFCRNVLIYLAPEAIARFLGAVHARMPERGWLFIGAAETLTAGARWFAPRRVDDVYVYRPRARRAVAHPEAAGGEGPARAARPEPAGARRAGRRAPAAETLPDPAALLAEAEEHAAAGRMTEAATAFRRASFLAPHDPLPLLGLGLALERDDPAGAARAFRAARAALHAGGGGGGLPRAELARLVDAKLAGGA